MQIVHDVSLRDFSTMRLGGQARHLATVTTRDDLLEALAWAKANDVEQVFMIGGGSNIIWRDEGFDGLLLVNAMHGYTERVEGKDHFVTIGAGEVWDDVVAQTVQSGLTGIEALSFIPGTAGGTPVQNVGAYGQRISDTLVSVEAYDRQINQFVSIPAEDCAFGYRTSRFKYADKGRFFITSITLHLTEGDPAPPFYIAVQEYFDAHDIHTYSPAILRDAVIAIRKVKLPDPAVIANNGSFFANPVVEADEAASLRKAFPAMPIWPGDGETFKIPAAWLIEQAGLKGFHDPETGMATWNNHALVLVNEHAKHADDLLAFKQKIVDAVQKKFGITLEQEPELLP